MWGDDALVQLLEELCAKHGTPAASVAVIRDGVMHTAATGTLNVATGVAATPDSVFQIGSISKTWTATTVMSLVDEGLLDLDTIVADVVPGLELATAQATQSVSIRHLLTHTSGIDGDHLVDTGPGDDALARYVQTLAAVPILFPAGATWSYSNSGFVLLGRVIEVLTGGTWEQAVQERIVGPLSLMHTSARPDELLRHRVAYGHVMQPGVPAALAPVWSMPRSLGPAGGTLCCSAADLARYGEAHLKASLLTPDSHAAMVATQATPPDTALAIGTGLSWALFDWSGTRIFGHNGGTFSQAAALRVVPDLGLVIAALLNTRAEDDAFFDALLRELLSEDGIEPPRPLEPVPGESLDLAAHVGRYARSGMELEIYATDAGGYGARMLLGDELASVVGANLLALPLAPGPEGRVLAQPPGMQQWLPMVFFDLADGQPYAWLAQAMPKVT